MTFSSPTSGSAGLTASEGSARGATRSTPSSATTADQPALKQIQPDVAVVVGDANSTLAWALVTAKSGALLAYVEAGLRSRDCSMPEEVNRAVTDRLSDYLFAPSPDAIANLQAEGYQMTRSTSSATSWPTRCWPTWTGRQAAHPSGARART